MQKWLDDNVVLMYLTYNEGNSMAKLEGKRWLMTASLPLVI